MQYSNFNQNFCKRCGTCCQKGGPTLHIQDIESIYNIPLHPKHLITLRKGELIWHPVKRQLITLEHEIIKIKGKKGSWACIFYDKTSRKCTCYKYRPIECRVLKCWDTKDVEKLFLKNTLTRKALLKTNFNLLELIEAYEEKFDLNYFFYLVRYNTTQEIKNFIEADEKFRKKVITSTKITTQELEFFFGRDLKTLLTQLKQII